MRARTAAAMKGRRDPQRSKVSPAQVFENSRMIRLALSSKPTRVRGMPRFSASKGSRLYIKESPMMPRAITTATWMRSLGVCSLFCGAVIGIYGAKEKATGRSPFLAGVMMF
jgi:hypothetical protein